MQLRLWARIATTLAVNLLLLFSLGFGVLLQQSRDTLDSFLYAPARERIRALGTLVEQEFPGKPEAERTAYLTSLEQRHGVTLAVYQDTGRLVAGPDLHAPGAVLQAMKSDWNRPPPRAGGPPMFQIKQQKPARYWIGYSFPVGAPCHRLDPCRARGIVPNCGSEVRYRYPRSRARRIRPPLP